MRVNQMKTMAMVGMAAIALMSSASCSGTADSADRRAAGSMTECPAFPGWAAGLTEVTIGPMELNPPDLPPTEPSFSPPIDVPQCSVIILNRDVVQFPYSFAPSATGILKQVSPAIDQIAFYVIGPVGTTLTIKVDVSTKGIYERTNKITFVPGQVTS